MDVSCEFSRLLAEKFAMASDGQRIESEGSKEGLAEYKNQNIEGSILITCGNTFVPGGELEWFSQR